MTRKKSNVKALALAVTCAILAGGGIGLKPVYAVDALYKENSTSHITTDATGATGNTATATKWKLTVIDSGLKIGGIDLGLTNPNAITIGSNTITATDVGNWKSVYSTVGDNNTTGTLAYNTQKISYNATTGTTVEGAITADSLTLSGNYNVQQNIEEAKGRITTVEGDLNTNQANLTALQGRVDGHDTEINTLKTKTQDIKYEKNGSTTVDCVNFNGGAVSGVKSINGKIEISADGKTVTFNRGETNGQVEISAAGIKVGTGSTYIKGDAIYTGDANYDNAKAGMKSDGSLKATGFAVDGATGDTTVGGTLSVAGETTFANGIKTDTIVEKTANAGVTVNGNKITTDNKFNDVELKNGNVNATDITANGALKGKTLGIGTNGTEFTVNADGEVQAAGGKVTIDKDGNAQFGDTGSNITKIQGNKITTGYIQTDNNIESSIGGVKMRNGQITASNMEITGAISLNDLTVNNKLTVDAFSVDKTGAVTGLQSINGVAVAKSGTGLTIGSATIGDANPFSSQGYTVDATGNVSAQDITAGKYNGNEITADKKFNGVELNGGNVKATNITDGQGFTATGGNVTAKNIQADTGTIAGVTFAAGGSVSGINDLTATGTIKGSILKVDENNYLNSEGLQAKKAVIDSVVIDDASITTTGANGLNVENVKLDNGAITANSATIGGVNTLDNTGITVNPEKSITLGASKITDGKVEVGSKTSLANEALILNDTNKWTNEGGLVADKATVNGIALGTDSKGKATFTDANGKITTIAGDKITTGTITADKLLIDKISLGKDGNDNISIDKNGDVTTKGDVTVTGDDNDTTVIDGAKATFGNDAANQTVIDKGKISAKAKAINDQQAGLKFDENGLTVSGQNAEGKTSSFSFNAETGASTFIDKDGTSTTINGSSVRSFNSATGAGHLNGATLNLWKDNDNSTYMTAGGVTFNGAAGEKGGKTTTINGGTITTDTLNVERINLGEDILDSNGNPHGSNLSMDKQGNFSAAGGNFKVTGGSGADKGAFTNTVGNTTLQTDNAGASMKFYNTAATGGVESKVAVEANKATVAAGDKASFVATTENGGTATITGGTQTVTTTDKGTVFENSAHKTEFVENGATNTIINGNEITTGKITTDQLVITGQGNAHGNGSIAFGGNGTIKSDINDGTANGKNTSFETTLDGVNTKVTDGTTTTENKVTAAGNSNTVTKDEKHKSEFNQGLTSIGGVVTNGEIKVAQKLDGATGLLTNEVTNADGKWSKLEQSGTGLTYTDSANAGNATRIDSSDVSIGSATEPDKRINLSDLGQIDELDSELKSREEFTSNPTAVGGINAEAAIRREEVARLDGRINDVNDRVNKVGAMAAAIASLKSIGYDPQAPSEFSIGLGQYKGETGVAMGFFHYPNKNFMINVSLSTAGGETMGGIGATWRFGHKSPQKLLEEQREAQAKKELAAAEKYQAAAKLAKEAQERAEYAAKLARQAQVSADNARAAADATQAKHFG